MHKEIVICFIIVVLVIIFNVLTMNFTQSAVETISNDLKDFKQSIIEEKVEDDDIKKKNSEIMNKWKEKYEILAYYIEHDELEKVETELTALEASIDVKQYEDGIENVDRCIFILNHIKDKYSFDIKNIF
ncbi:MAG: DUF4363 family protein [Clostridia bacterium]|nr:DUF4363 family protein [Clostridia bacterium]